jgi:ElaB/YqjD/DUF883 family membrane-anchored ribosome-binding protein
MDSGKFEGAARSIVGRGEQVVGNLLKDDGMKTRGNIDEVAGKAQSAVASAKDAIASGVDAASSIDLTGLRDEIAALTQTVSDIVRKQANMTKDQIVGAVGTASDSLSQSASDAQDKLMSMEADMGARIRKNPWGAVAIAGLIGLLIGRMA